MTAENGGRAGDGGARSRLDALWARIGTETPLDREEEAELARALAEDGQLRADFLDDQRLEAALLALGRGSQEADGDSFARQFVARVAAERDGSRFVSSVDLKVRAEAARRGPRATWRFLRWLAPAVAVATLGLWWLSPGRQHAQRAIDEQPLASLSRTKQAQEATRPAPPALPVPATRPAPAAEIGLVSGVAFVLMDAQRTPAAAGAPLPAGAGLITVGSGSRAVIQYRDRTRLELDGDTVIAQQGEAGGGRAVDKAAFLARGRLSVEAAPPPPGGRPLLVTTPHAELTVLGTRFALFVDGTATRVDVFEGKVQMARLGGGSPAVVSGSQYAVMGGDRGDVSVATMSRGGLALFLAGSVVPSTADERVKKRLEALGLEVHLQVGGPPTADDLRRAKIVVISSTAWARDLNVHYRDLPVPIVTWEPLLYDELGMTGAERRTDQGYAVSTGEAVIENATHPLAAGRSGTVSLVDIAPDAVSRKYLRQMSWGAPGPHAQVIARWPGTPGRAVLFAYERGAPMPGLPAAPARRVGLFLQNYTAQVMSDAGWALFDAAITWAMRDTGMPR
jgi:FecR protein